MRKQIFILFTSFFFFLVVTAQEKYRAVHWGVEEGLSQGVVYQMIKDINGFLWIGTFHGLNRFDGSSFRTYFADKTNKNTAIAGNEINGLIEDSLHNIWIGTDKGLTRYDIKADTFKNFYSFPANAASNSLIIPFWATRDEVFCWDYSESQLAAFNIKSFVKRSLVKIFPADSAGHGVSDRYPIFDAGSNNIWVEKGASEWAGGGLLQISLTTGKKKQFNWPCYRKIANHSHASEGMRFDRRRNSIWISSPDGLIEFTLKDRQFHHIEALNEMLKVKDFTQWAGIDIDAKGRVWMGTYPKGIIIYDPASHSLNLAFPDDSVQQQNVSEANVFIYCDRDGLMWSGSWSSKGIYQIIPFSPAIIHYVADSKQKHFLSNEFAINCIDAGQGKVWIATLEDINIFDPHTGLFQVLQKKDLSGLPEEVNRILISSIDTTIQKAWIHVDDFLYEMDIATKICRPVTYKDSANRRIPLPGGFPTPYKKTFILSTSDDAQQGIFIVNNDSAVAEQVLSFHAGTIDIFKTATDDEDFIFLRRLDSTLNLTYGHRDGKWILMPTPLDSIQWTKIIYNKADQTFWLAAEKSLYHYNKKFHPIRIYTQQDGLPDHEICGMIPDKKNNIWFNTESSIHRLDIQTGRITSLSEKDGFQKQGFTSVLNFGESAAGELYLPGGVLGQGFNRINPAKYTHTSSSVYLQSLEINQKPFSLQTGVNDQQQLSLRYFENKIAIETGNIDYYSKGKGHIRYKLEIEGKNVDWQYAPDYYSIRYEELPPGNYRLVMQACNVSNEYNGPEKILIIHISPPFWKTWWFRILAVLFGIALLYAFIQVRSRTLRRRNVFLEDKVIQRTNELKNSLEELKETQAQLIQREKMASLGELTAGIAHEIQNPLNFVKNFSEVSSELLDEMETELEKGNKDDVNAIRANIKQNLGKIIHHGNRADVIVKGMLQHSRISSGQKEMTNLNALTDEYLRLSYHGLRAKDKSFNATIKTDFDESIGKINIIQQDIGRVILNLFNNAFYSIAEKKKLSAAPFEPTVSVTTKKTVDKIELRVRDNGNGIPEKVMNKIFQPFFTTKPTGEGTGLGLSLSYDIITKGHGGELKMETKEGEFAEFIIQLPVQEVAEN